MSGGRCIDTYLFTGTITTVAPLACSPPGHMDRHKCARLPRMAMLSAAGPLDTVFVPGATIRGKLRHACADAWLERERPVDYLRYLALKVGGVKGAAEETRVGLRARRDFLAREPFLDLFGAGDSAIGWIHSRLDVGAALPVEPTQAAMLNGARGDTAQDPIVFEVLDESEHDRVRESVGANRRRSQAAGRVRACARDLEQAKRSGQDTAALERRLAEAERAAHAAAEAQVALVGSAVSLPLPLGGYEAIPPGTALAHRMFFRHVSQIQMRLFMAGLARFAQDPRFGARRAQGCGRVCMEYRIKRIEGLAARPVGAVCIDPRRWDDDESSLALSGAPERWLRAWHDDAPAP